MSDKHYRNDPPEDVLPRFETEASEGYQSDPPARSNLVRRAWLRSKRLALWGLVNSWDRLGMEDAASLLRCFLNGRNSDPSRPYSYLMRPGPDGTTVSIDEAIRESGTFKAVFFDKLVRPAAEMTRHKILAGYRSGEIHSGWTSIPSFGLIEDMNWFNALGGCTVRSQTSFAPTKPDEWELKLVFFLRDIYDFENKTGGDFIYDHLEDLHRAGYARNFAVAGQSRSFLWQFSIASGRLESPEFIWQGYAATL